MDARDDDAQTPSTPRTLTRRGSISLLLVLLASLVPDVRAQDTGALPEGSTVLMRPAAVWDRCKDGVGHTQAVSDHDVVRNGDFELGLAGWKVSGQGEARVSSSAAYLSRKVLQAPPARREGFGVELRVPRGAPQRLTLSQEIFLPQTLESLRLAFFFQVRASNPSGIWENPRVEIVTRDAAETVLWSRDFSTDPRKDPAVRQYRDDEARGWLWFRLQTGVTDDSGETTPKKGRAKIDLRALERARAARQPLLLRISIKGQGVYLQLDKLSLQANGSFEWPPIAGSIAFAVDNHGGQPGYAVHCISPDSTSRSELMMSVGRPHGQNGRPFGLSWRPNGQALVLASSHEAEHSRWRSDLYLMLPERLLRMTNPPSHLSLIEQSLPEGSIEGEVINKTGQTLTVQVYVQGGRSPATLTIPVSKKKDDDADDDDAGADGGGGGGGGTSMRFSLDDIADLGLDIEQYILVRSKDSTWRAFPGVDIRERSRVSLSQPLVISDENAHQFAESPTWRFDGSMVAFSGDHDTLSTLNVGMPGATPLPLFRRLPLPYGQFTAWSPVDERLLFVIAEGDSENHGVWIIDPERDAELLIPPVDGATPQHPAWLPDGSGFVYTLEHCVENDDVCDTDLYLYQFGLASRFRLARFFRETIEHPSVSPDGRYIAFTRALEWSGFRPRRQRSLWVMKMGNPSIMWPLVTEGDPSFPTWSRSR